MGFHIVLTAVCVTCEANSFYASDTAVNGDGVLWFNDRKHYLLGRRIGSKWLEGAL